MQFGNDVFQRVTSDLGASIRMAEREERLAAQRVAALKLDKEALLRAVNEHDLKGDSVPLLDWLESHGYDEEGRVL